MIYEPRLLKYAPDHFFSDANGTIFSAFMCDGSLNLSLSAMKVAFVSSRLCVNPHIISSIISFSVASSYTTKSATSIQPSVIVPVLSRHNTSTLASVSIQYNSCTSTLLLDNLMTLTAKTVLVKSINPSGIIPITAATVFTTAFCICASTPPNKFGTIFPESSLGMLYCRHIIINASGNIIAVNAFIIQFSVYIISELTFFAYFASAEIFAA